MKENKETQRKIETYEDLQAFETFFYKNITLRGYLKFEKWIKQKLYLMISIFYFCMHPFLQYI